MLVWCSNEQICDLLVYHAEWQFLNDAAGQPIRSIFKGTEIQERKESDEQFET